MSDYYILDADKNALPVNSVGAHMSLILPRRRFLAGLATLFAAPAIVRASSLMPVKAMEAEGEWIVYQTWFPDDAWRRINCADGGVFYRELAVAWGKESK